MLDEFLRGVYNPSRQHPIFPGLLVGYDVRQMEKEMADSIDIHRAPSPEEVAYKLLYAVAWAENIDLEGWAKTDRKWILNTYAECLLAVLNPAQRMASPPADT